MNRLITAQWSWTCFLFWTATSQTFTASTNRHSFSSLNSLWEPLQWIESIHGGFLKWYPKSPWLSMLSHGRTNWMIFFHVPWGTPFKRKPHWNRQRQLVGGFNPSEKYEFFSWDDEIPNIWKNKSHVPNHQPGSVYCSWTTFSSLPRSCLITSNQPGTCNPIANCEPMAAW